jgi:hypothetical protein
MKGKSLAKIGMAFVIAAAVMIWCVPAKAYTFGFDDMYLVKSGNAFPGTSVTVSSSGIYQETQDATHGGVIITKLAGLTTSVPGEFVQNTTPNASSELQLYGWGQSLNYGQKVDTVYNLQDTANGAVLYFRYAVGGTAQPFTFNGFDLKTVVGSVNATFEALDASNHILDTATVTLSSGFTTFSENWTNVYEIQFTAPGGTANVYMDNVEINDPVPSVPEPATLLLLGFGLVGLAASRRKFKKA